MSWPLKDLIVFRIEKADFYLLQTWLAHKRPDVWTQLEKIGLEELPEHIAVIQVDHERRTVWCVASYPSQGYPPEAQQKLSEFWASIDAGVRHPKSVVMKCVGFQSWTRLLHYCGSVAKR